jgi:hypothetical protein
MRHGERTFKHLLRQSLDHSAELLKESLFSSLLAKRGIDSASSHPKGIPLRGYTFSE